MPKCLPPLPPPEIHGEGGALQQQCGGVRGPPRALRCPGAGVRGGAGVWPALPQPPLRGGTGVKNIFIV